MKHFRYLASKWKEMRHIVNLLSSWDLLFVILPFSREIFHTPYRTLFWEFMQRETLHSNEYFPKIYRK